MAYNVVYKRSVERDLKRMDKAVSRWLLAKIEEDLPQKAEACPSLKGKFAGFCKYRAGDYRIIFTLKEDNIAVLRIGHRGSVYR